MIKCLTCNRKFEQYAQQLVWDGKWIKCCPICGVTEYDGEFKKLKNRNNINN